MPDTPKSTDFNRQKQAPTENVASNIKSKFHTIFSQNRFSKLPFPFHRNMRIPAAILALFLLLVLSFTWLSSHIFSENARFEKFAESIFEKEVSGNALNLHYSLAYPEKQGISRPRATLGTIPPDNEKAAAQCLDYEKKLKTFSASKLSSTNRLTLDLLLLYYHTEATLGDRYLLEEPLSPSLGIQAQLPVLLAEYAFYENQDITDYLNLLCSTGDYFQSILAFEQAKSDAGFFMCDETLDRIQEQCRAFIQNPDSNYMLEIFSQKLQNYGKLSSQDQEQLIRTHKQILQEKVLPAYQKLIEGLEQLRGTGKNTGGLANFSGGKEYYQYLLQSQVGIYLPVEKLEKRLTQQLSADSQELSLLLEKYPELLSLLEAKADLPGMEPEQIITTLETAISQDFPSTPSVDFEIRSVHKSMEEFLSPAFYLTPPMDTGAPNVIYINHGRQISNLELFTTLAHEGFPGHLYQTVYFGRQNPSHIRYLIDYSGYVEGWATYVESYAYGYAASYLSTSQGSATKITDPPATADLQASDTFSEASAYTRLSWLNRSVNLCIYSLLDVGIHYRGWTPTQAARFLNLFGIRDAHVTAEIYRYIAETPANYLKYYVGYLNFLDLKEEQQTLLGENFDLKAFHQQILSIGPVQFPVLRKYINEALG